MNHPKQIRRVRIHGILRLISNLLISTPGENHTDTTGGKLEFREGPVPSDTNGQKTSGKFPCTSTICYAIASDLGDIGQTGLAQGGLAAGAGLGGEGEGEDDTLETLRRNAAALDDAPGQENPPAVPGATNTVGVGNGQPRRNNVMGFDLFPIIPCTSFRGRLRREMTEVILDVLLGRGQQISMEAFHGLSCGAASGSPDKVGGTFKEIMFQRHNPLIGLFGGGPKLIASALTTPTLWPVVARTLALGMVPAKFEGRRNLTPVRNLTQVLPYTRIDDAYGSRANTRLSTALEGGDDAMLKWIIGLQRTDKKKAADEPAVQGKDAPPAGDKKKPTDERGERSKDTLQTLQTMRVIIPNTRFYLPMIVDTSLVGLAGLGLLLLSFLRLANTQRLGGKSSDGFGMFDLDLTLGDADDDGVPEVPLFVRSPISGQLGFNPNATLVGEAIAAWHEFATDKVNNQVLKEIYTPAVKAEAEAAAAKGKAEPATEAAAS